MVDKKPFPCPSITCNDEKTQHIKIELRHSPLFDKDKPPNSLKWTCEICGTSFYEYEEKDFTPTLETLFKRGEKRKRPKFDSHAFDTKAFVDD